MRRLAESLQAWDEVKEIPSLEQKVVAVASRRYLRPINKEPLIEFLTAQGVPSSSKEKVAKHLSALEDDIEYCGILVTKRVYEVFFSPENKPKWNAYLQAEHDLTSEQAEEVMRGVDILPASKRKPKETFLTLGGAHMTHTEFPNHQMNMLMASLEAGFDLEEFVESVLRGISPEVLHRLTAEWVDISGLFAEAYELTPDQLRVLGEAKVTGGDRYGERGISPSQWRTFGATDKTMVEFSGSYERFREKCIKFVSKMALEG